MSEYWKSTPKYYCKFCKTYVRDTKFERQQHDATGRHQGNIQRSLRNLHRDNEREESQKQRAKDEVARLNGIVSGNSASSSASSPASASASASASNSAAPKPASNFSLSMPAPGKVNLEERKSQMKQLADMGVAIPDQFRGDLALAGEWQTVSERKIDQPGAKSESALSYGVRKRKLAGEESDDDDNNDNNTPATTDAADVTRRKTDWGSRYRSYPDTIRGAASTSDIEALLNQSSTPQQDSKLDVKDIDKTLGEASPSNETSDPKPEPSTPEDKLAPAEPTNESAAEDSAPVVFKKRKSKAAKVK